MRKTTDDKVVEMYFESEKHSGGGSIRHMSRDRERGKAEITFQEDGGKTFRYLVKFNIY